MNSSSPVIKNPLQQEQGLLYGFFFAEDQPAQSIDLEWSAT